MIIFLKDVLERKYSKELPMITHGRVEQLPFGGVGHSGMGGYHGKFGFDTFTHKKVGFRLFCTNVI